MSRTKIVSLSLSERGRLREWRDKWVKIGLSTEPADFETFEKNVELCYRFAKLKPVPVIKVESPIVGAFAASIAMHVICSVFQAAIRRTVMLPVDSTVKSAADSAVYSVVSLASDSAVDSDVASAVESAVDSAVRSAVDSAVGSAVLSAVDSDVASAVDLAVGSAVLSAVESAVGSAVLSAVGSAVGSNMGSAVDSAIYSAFKDKKLNWHNWIGGRFWSAWQAYVTFFRYVCGWTPPTAILDRMRAYEKCQSSAGYWWANRDFCIVSNTPKKIERKENALHCENGKAIEYRDGWGLYFLNGVRMKEEYVMTPAEKIKPETILSEKNVDVRRELIRKIGVERLVSAGKLLEQKNGYSLYDMSAVFHPIDRAVFLLMKNPSVPGVFHMEGVAPNVKTIQEALNWRRYGNMKKEWNPEILT